MTKATNVWTVTRRRLLMPEFTFEVKQIIQVEAKDIDEAMFLLPSYPYSPNPAWYMQDEHIKETK
jgi:hypothetical protein